MEGLQQRVVQRSREFRKNRCAFLAARASNAKDGQERLPNTASDP